MYVSINDYGLLLCWSQTKIHILLNSAFLMKVMRVLLESLVLPVKSSCTSWAALQPPVTTRGNSKPPVNTTCIYFWPVGQNSCTQRKPILFTRMSPEATRLAAAPLCCLVLPVSWILSRPIVQSIPININRQLSCNKCTPEQLLPLETNVKLSEKQVSSNHLFAAVLSSVLGNNRSASKSLANCFLIIFLLNI